MSYEAFETVASCDMRTAPDRRGIEYGRAGEGYPRWTEDRNGWATCHPWAHELLELAARAIEEQEMRGLTGDHPEKREQAAKVIRAVAELVKELAADHACDGAMTADDWAAALERVRRALADPATDGPRARPSPFATGFGETA